ncbi:MAG: methyltransferase family protein [Capsulimonadaceae bacterium]
MSIFVKLIGTMWLAFWLYWLLRSRGNKPSIRDGAWRRGAAVRLILFVGLFVWIRVSIIRHFLHHGGVLMPPVGGAVGVLLCAAGLAFAIWARVHLGRNWGIPMSVRQEHELVTSGPYAYVRHPIYTGILLAMFGSALAYLPWLAAFVLSSVYFVYSALTEEKAMLRQFPDQYPQYQTRTKMLIPSVF